MILDGSSLSAITVTMTRSAHRALDSLRPESRVWRKDWQLEAYSL